jgi:hypothetical protein
MHSMTRATRNASRTIEEVPQVMSKANDARAVRTSALTLCVACCLFCSVTTLAGTATPPEQVEDVAIEPGDVCERGYTDYYWTLDDEFCGNESYRVFCPPSQCSDCAGGWKPLSVTMYLYWETRNTCSLTVQARLRRAIISDSGAPVPGDVITVSEPTAVGPFEPAGLWAVTVALPRDCPTIDGACFATLSFLDTCDDRPAIVATPTECTATSTWVSRGDGWVDLVSCDYPGNPSLFATFECQYPNEEQPVAWSAIKSRFTD